MPARPFLKWVGGKSALLPTIRDALPAEVDAYIEPFLGGGSVLFEVLRLEGEGEFRAGRYVAGDVNAALIGCYQCVRSRLDEMLEEVKQIRAAHAEAIDEGRAPAHYWSLSPFSAGCDMISGRGR